MLEGACYVLFTNTVFQARVTIFSNIHLDIGAHHGWVNPAVELNRYVAVVLFTGVTIILITSKAHMKCGHLCSPKGMVDILCVANRNPDDAVGRCVVLLCVTSNLKGTGAPCLGPINQMCVHCIM